MPNDPIQNITWHGHQLLNFGGHEGCVTAVAISFPQASPLSAKRLVDGIALTIPAGIEVVPKPAFQIANIRAIVSFDGTDVAVANDYNIYASHGARSAALVASLPANVIRHIERIRAGGAITFTLQMHGEVSRLFENNAMIFGTAPQAFDFKTNVTYPRDTWVTMLNETGMGENVVVEVPLPPCPSDDWQPIWKALATARDSVKGGGDTAWKSAIVECRHALELWQKLEKEDHGPGWKAPTMIERNDRTRQQRLDNIRWDLLQCAHEAAHSPADKWTRDDAVLVLAALAALLRIRNP